MRKIILIIITSGGGLSELVILLGIIYAAWTLSAFLSIGVMVALCLTSAILPVVALFLLKKRRPGHLSGIFWGILAAVTSTMILQWTRGIWAASSLVAPAGPLFVIGIGLALAVYFLWPKK